MMNSSGSPTPGGALTSSARPYTEYWQYEMYVYTIRYASPVLILAGTLCNMVCLVVLNTASYRGSSTGFLLSALAIVDIGVLDTGLLRIWVRTVWGSEADLRLQGDPACKIHMFFTYLCGQLSGWTLVLITLERVICVCVPLRCRELCSMKRISICWSVICLILILINSHFYWTVSIVQHDTYRSCEASPEYQHFINVSWQWLDLFLVCFGPFCIILIGNFIITGKMLSMMVARRQHLQVSSQASDKTRSTTVMLMVVSGAFLLLTSPSSVYFIGMSYQQWPLEGAEDVAEVYGAYALCYVLYYCNSSANFLLYCASGTRFRAALRSLCCKADRYRSNTTTSGVSHSTANANTHV